MVPPIETCQEPMKRDQGFRDLLNLGRVLSRKPLGRHGRPLDFLCDFLGAGA